MVKTPFPPLFCALYCDISVLFPKPFSVATKTVVPSLFINNIPTSLSSSELKVIPFTPIVFLPLGLICSSENLIDLPLRVPNNMSLSPVETRASISLSPSLISTAYMPFFLGFEYADSFVFLTIPFSVAITTK